MKDESSKSESRRKSTINRGALSFASFSATSIGSTDGANGARRFTFVRTKLKLRSPRTAQTSARVRHLFAAGPIARLNLELADGQIIDAEIPRPQLDAMELGPGDEVGLRFRAVRRFREES